MTIQSKAGNQPDTNDMADATANDGDFVNAGSSHPNLEDEDEEAAKLANFA